MEAARRNEPRTLDLQARLCEIPAPPFQEAVRGRELKRPVPGTRPARRALDAAATSFGVPLRQGSAPNWYSPPTSTTVFPEGTNVKVTRAGDLLKASRHRPTIAAAWPSCSRHRRPQRGPVETPGTITFVADTGGGRAGRLARHEEPLSSTASKDRSDKFVSVDGTGPASPTSASGSTATR